jgi:hypothetical protein
MVTANPTSHHAKMVFLRLSDFADRVVRSSTEAERGGCHIPGEVDVTARRYQANSIKRSARYD